MCIHQSVGLNGINERADARTIQILINMNIGRVAPLAPLLVDGAAGAKTFAAIGEFQRRVLPAGPVSELVEPGSETLRQLRAGVPANLNEAKLNGILSSADGPVITRYFLALVSQMQANEINTPLRMAHFLAQVGHESGDLRFSEELADGSQYEGRIDLGNTQAGDGPRFKGRGLIQLTGRANYAAYGRAKNRDFLTPENYKLIATDPILAVDVAGWFWVKHGLNELADTDNVQEITRRINGGFNGLADRQDRLARAKWFLLQQANVAAGSS